MNYSNKLAWKRYQRLRREYQAAILSKRQGMIEKAQHRLDSFVLTYLLFNECRQRQGVGSTRE